MKIDHVITAQLFATVVAVGKRNTEDEDVAESDEKSLIDQCSAVVHQWIKRLRKSGGNP